MKVSVILLLINLVGFSFAKENVKDYYWQPFDGEIPEDAFISGLENNQPVYIGRTVYEELIIPGKLYKNDNHIYFELNGRALKTKFGITILCSKHPEKLEWIPSSTKAYSEIKTNHLIRGGYEPGYDIYIGYVHLGDWTSGVDVGKIVCKDSACLALYTTRDDTVRKYHVYYILSYNPGSN